MVSSRIAARVHVATSSDDRAGVEEEKEEEEEMPGLRKPDEESKGWPRPVAMDDRRCRELVAGFMVAACAPSKMANITELQSIGKGKRGSQQGKLVSVGS